MSTEKENSKFRTGSFKTPDNYDNELRNELQLKTVLDAHKNDFKVPEGYFDSLSKEISRKKVTPVRSISGNIWLRISAVTAVAASLLVAVLWLQSTQECESFACLIEQTELQPDDLIWVESSYIEEMYSDELGSSFSDEEEKIIDLAVEEDWDLEYLLEE